MPAPHRHATGLLLLVLAVVCGWAVAGCGGGHHKPPTPAACAHGYRTQYGCAAHAPSFGLPPKGLTLPRSASLTGTVDMYDSVTVSQIPASSVAVAGYTSGFFPTYPVLLRAFPRAHVVSIAINTFHFARCGDFEPGDMNPATDAAPWYFAERAHGIARPCEYASLSDMAKLRANLAAHGIARSSVFLWDANWTFVRHLDLGYDATQWTDHAFGRNLDASVVTQDFLGIKPAPPVDPYAIFDQTRRHLSHSVIASEHNTVSTWDRAHCLNPVKRPVCKSSRFHMQLLRDRAVFVATHRPPSFRQRANRFNVNHLESRVGGMQARLHASR